MKTLQRWLTNLLSLLLISISLPYQLFMSMFKKPADKSTPRTMKEFEDVLRGEKDEQSE